ncbi:hypothetical protein ACQJBY_061303 [Aegilops geniculata]
MELSTKTASSADAQICAAKAATKAFSGDKRQGSENSIDQIDPKTHGWTKRVRVGAAALGRAPCPDRISALEKTITQFAEQPGDIVIVPKIGTSFDTLGEAYDFSKLYLWEKGFDIRYGNGRLNVNRAKCMQEIVCGCAVRHFLTNYPYCFL